MSAALLGLAFRAEASSPVAKLILLKLVDCARDDGRQIYPSASYLARAGQCSDRHVRNVMAEFRAIGLLRLVENGGSGQGSTNHYEMDLDILNRMAELGWDAFYAAHCHASNAGQGELLGIELERSKAEVSSALVPGRRNSTTRKAEPQFRQSLKRTLIDERERVDASAQASAAESHAPDAGHGDEKASSAKSPTLASFRAKWPTGQTDDPGRTKRAWRKLPDLYRSAAIAGIEPFIAALRRDGRKFSPAGWKYLNERMWLSTAAISSKAPAAPGSDGFAVLDPFSPDWWQVAIDRVRFGQPCSFFFQSAEEGKGLTVAKAELALAGDRVGSVTGYASDGPEAAAWASWFAARRVRLPASAGAVVFLPSPTVPSGW